MRMTTMGSVRLQSLRLSVLMVPHPFPQAGMILIVTGQLVLVSFNLLFLTLTPQSQAATMELLHSPQPKKFLAGTCNLADLPPLLPPSLITTSLEGSCNPPLTYLQGGCNKSQTNTINKSMKFLADVSFF